MADSSLYTLLIDLKANTAQLASDMDKAVGIMTRATTLMAQSSSTLAKSINGIFEGFGQAIGQDLISKIEEIGSAIGDLAERGAKVNDITEGFERLGGSSDAIDAASDALLGTVSKIDLMAAANAGLSRGIPDLNKNFATLADYAGRFAAQQGKDVVETLDNLINAVGSGRANQLAKFGIYIEDTGSKAGNMAEAVAKAKENLDRFAPSIDSAGKSQVALSVEFKNVYDVVAKSVDKNDELKDAYRDLIAQIEKISWTQFGDDIARIAVNFVTLASSVVQVIPSLVSLASKFDLVGVAANNAYLYAEQLRLSALKTVNVRSPQQMIADNIGVDFLGSAASRDSWQQTEASYDQQIKAIQQQITANNFKLLFGSLPTSQQTGTSSLSGNGTGQALVKGPILDPGAVQQASDDLDELTEKLKKMQDDANLKGIKTGLDTAITTGDSSSFQTLLEKLRDTTSAGFLAGNQEFIDEGTPAMGDAILAMSKQVGQEAVDDYVKKWQTAQDQIQTQSIQSWESMFNLVISGFQDNFKSALKELAVGFGSALMSSLVGSLAGLKINSFTDVGALLGRSVLGEALGTGEFGTAATGAAGGSSGLLGGLLGGSVGSGGGALSGILGSAGIDATETSLPPELASEMGIGLQSAADGGTILAGGAEGSGILGSVGSLGPYAAAAVALYALTKGGVGKQILQGIGIGGPPKNPDTIGRDDMGTWLTQQLQGFGGLQMANSSGGESLLSSIDMGNSNAFKGDWAGDLSKNAGQASALWEGLGVEIKKVSGATQGVGEQFGAVLGQNLAYNVDNARHLVQQLGLSFDDVKNNIIQAGIQNNETWGQIEAEIAGVHDAFQPGLAAIGAYNQAFTNLIQSGAKGYQAIGSLKDIAVEAAEAGITSFDALRVQLDKTFDPAEVTAFFSSLAANGITSFSQLQNASDDTLGAIIAHMQALGVTFTDVANSADTLNSSTKSLITTLKSGSSTTSTSALVTRGASSVLPVTSTINSKMLTIPSSGQIAGGASGGYVINIDARGADAGVEAKIRSAMKDAEDRAVRRITKSAQLAVGRSA